MRVIPVDTARVGRFQFVAANPKTDQDGEQMVTDFGVPRWMVQVLLTPLPTDGFQPKATLVEVNISDIDAPAPPPLTEVDFFNLTARPWSMNGRSGISLSADEVVLK